MDKQNCRKELLKKRDRMDHDTAAMNSKSVCDKLKSLNDFNHVMLYLATGNELNLDEFIDYLMERGVSVYVPVCTGKGIMEASLLNSMDDDLEIGTFSIRAPKKEAQRFYDPTILDAVIVPGVGFDTAGNRLGFGGGFYDRYLPRTTPKCKKIAVCHDFQFIDYAYPEDHDFPMDMIVTNQQIYYVEKEKAL